MFQLKLQRKTFTCLVVAVIIAGLSISSNSPHSTCPTQFGKSTSSIEEQPLEECTSIIVTGTAAKDGRAILMKNRDSYETHNVPVYHAATNDTYAFVAVNSMWMGINEMGLAVMNTAMPDLSEGPDFGSFNGPLNKVILEQCQNVSEVISRLFAKNDPLIPTEFEAVVASCVGVIDRHGAGAFLEVSNTAVSVEYVVNGYQSRANHPRTYDGLASGPNGRDQYALDALDRIFDEKGVISWQDVAQEVSRYVQDKEEGTSSFSINGEVCNPSTVSAMVAVSGDARYNGSLNTMWCEYGQVPMIGVFVPTFVACGQPPTILDDMVEYTSEKRAYATGGTSAYNPTRVAQIQEYAFAAEDYTFEQYDRLMNQIPLGLSQDDLLSTLDAFTDLTVSVAVDMYVNETAIRPEYAISFDVTATGISPDTSASTPLSTITYTTSFTNDSNPVFLGNLVIGFTGGILGVIVIFFVVSRRTISKT